MVERRFNADVLEVVYAELDGRELCLCDRSESAERLNCDAVMVDFIAAIMELFFFLLLILDWRCGE